MDEFRKAVLNNGTKVDFEDLMVGDIFKIQEPNGEIHGLWEVVEEYAELHNGREGIMAVGVEE